VIFTGHSDHAIDAKLRLAIPAKHRNQLKASADGHAWYCVPAESSLRLYTQETFEELAERMESSLVPDSDRAELDLTLFGLAERLEMDAQGRIPLPKRHLELAGLQSGEVVIVGARNRLEVRDRAAWNASQHERVAKLPALVDRIQSRGRSAGGI
jgi:MraZ protein